MENGASQSLRPRLHSLLTIIQTIQTNGQKRKKNSINNQTYANMNQKTNSYAAATCLRVQGQCKPNAIKACFRLLRCSLS